MTRGPLVLMGVGVVIFLLAAIAIVKFADVQQRVVRVEQREKVNACVDGAPRPCRMLLNRLLAYADHDQRVRIRRADVARAELLEAPRVTAPPKRGGSPREPRPDRRPPATVPPRSPFAPTPSPSQPNPGPTGTPTTPSPPRPPERELLPPKVREPLCVRLPTLPVCE